MRNVKPGKEQVKDNGKETVRTGKGRAKWQRISKARTTKWQRVGIRSYKSENVKPDQAEKRGTFARKTVKKWVKKR